MKSKQEKTLLEAAKRICEWKYKPYIKKIILYGSCARGDYNCFSDVDIYLECEEGIPVKELREFRADIAFLGDGFSDVDLHYGFSPLSEQEGLFYRNIEKEGDILWEKS